MSPSTSSRLARLLRLYLDVVLAISLLACIILALWLLASPLIMRSRNARMEAGIPVAIGTRSIRPVIPVEIQSDGSTSISSLQIVDAYAELRFSTTSWGLQFVCNLGYLLGALAAIVVIYLIRSVLQDVVKGVPFGPKSANKIRFIGLVLALAGIFGPVVEYFVARFILAHIASTIPPLSPPLYFRSEVLLSGLLVLVLAQVWVYGMGIEQEQALTI